MYIIILYESIYMNVYYIYTIYIYIYIWYSPLKEYI